MSPPRPHMPDGVDADQLLEEFEAAWRRGQTPAIEHFVPPPGPERRPHLEDLVKLDLEYRWRQPTADHWRLEDYVKRLPDLGPAARLSADLIGEEYLARQRWGDKPGHAEYLARFPAQAAALPRLLGGIDKDLAAEFSRKGRAGPESAPEIALPTGVIEPITTIPKLVDALRFNGLFNDDQLKEVAELQRRGGDLRALAKELLARDWLTPYQINQLLQGRGQELVLGPYHLLERLGSGSSGWVFKARHKYLQRLVALKVLRRELLTDPDIVARFYREIRGVSQLSHPHVVHAYDAGPIGRTHVLIMEYAPGTDLSRLVQQSGALAVPDACEYVCQTALGLQHIHDRGLVHRDIKPSNLLLLSGVTPQIKILDLGLARLGKVVRGLAPGRLLQGGSSASLTPTGAVMMGTPDFLAPEQALDFRQADRRADLYSLGCTLFFLLAGQPPFPGGSVARKLLRHHQSAPPDLTGLRGDVPPALNQLVQALLAKDPAQRPASAAAVIDALAAALPGRVAPLSQRHAQPVDDATAWPAPLLAPSGKAWLESTSAWLLPDSPPEGRAGDVSPPVSAATGGLTSPARQDRRRWGVSVAVAALLLLGLAVPVAFLLLSAPGVPPPTGPARAAPTAPAPPPVDYAVGFGSPRGLALNGAAQIRAGRLHLTPGGNRVAGSVYAARPLDVRRFTSEFRFQLPRGRSTDGLTFVVQGNDATALGPDGGGLGYGPDTTGTARGIPRSVAVKFDYHSNQGEGPNSTGLFLDGVAPTVPAVTLAGTGVDLHTDHIFHVQLHYDGTTLRVRIADDSTRAAATQSYKVDIPRTVGGPTAFVGFTASSGGGTNATPDILNWTYQPQ